MSKTPTNEQNIIINEKSGHFAVRACPGSGKTFGNGKLNYYTNGKQKYYANGKQKYHSDGKTEFPF